MRRAGSEFDLIRHNQNRASSPKDRNPRIKREVPVVRPCFPSYDHEIRSTGFVRNQIAGVLHTPSPFQVPDALGRGAKFPPEVGEIIQLILLADRSCCVDCEPLRHQSGNVRPSGNADQRRFKPIRQVDGEMDAPICAWRRVEMHHEGRVRHRLLNSQCANRQQIGLSCRRSRVTPPNAHSPNRECP